MKRAPRDAICWRARRVPPDRVTLGLVRCRLAVDRVVFSTDCVTIGAFRCAVDHPSFRNSGPIRDDCFVFPRTAVVIQHDERARRSSRTRRSSRSTTAVSSTSVAPVSADGDRCDWFAVSPDLLRGALADRDPAAADDERPIRFTHAPADAVDLPGAAPAVRRRRRRASADPLDVEERVVGLLDRVLGLAYADARAGRRRRGRLSAADLADAAKRWVAPRVAQRLTLSRIARALRLLGRFICADRSGARPA